MYFNFQTILARIRKFGGRYHVGPCICITLTQQYQIESEFVQSEQKDGKLLPFADFNLWIQVLNLLIVDSKINQNTNWYAPYKKVLEA